MMANDKTYQVMESLDDVLHLLRTGEKLSKAVAI
jgi:hypothetical protein